MFEWTVTRPCQIPSEGLPVAIGAHEISGQAPRCWVSAACPVDVKHGGLTEVILRFDYYGTG